jgi:hypothetical protein
MKTGLWISLAVVAIVALVFIALTVGWAVWGRQLWRAGSFVAAGGCGDPQAGARPGMMGRGFGPGMMPGAVAPGAGPAVPGGCGTGLAAPGGCGPGPSVPGGCAAAGQAGSTAVLSGTLTIEQAREAVERYVAGLGDSNLAVGEVMEFEQNFYAIVKESNTGIGALEVLVDKRDGAVFPEMGPNMMWNGRYGMHSRMMRGAVAPGGNVSETNTLTADEAKEIAQRWLDANRPGVTVEDVDPFYGYYTVHTMKGDQIEGMLSVHGSTGQVWYHTWHGKFIQMIE